MPAAQSPSPKTLDSANHVARYSAAYHHERRQLPAMTAMFANDGSEIRVHRNGTFKEPCEPDSAGIRMSRL
jgi:type II secretory pathway component PulK